MSKAYAVCRRFVCLVAVFIFLMAAPLWFLPAKAEVPTSNSLKVYAQYWGDPDSAVLLGEYSREQLDALSYGEYGYEGYYGNINTFNNVLRIHARGVRLAEFLSEVVLVDLNSVRQIDFHTTDNDAGERFLSKGRWELLDSPHYYYPNLKENSQTGKERGEFIVEDEAWASEGAVPVPTLLAVVQYSTTDPGDRLLDPMSTDDTFRLCIGQPDLTTKSSFESARGVDEIYIVLNGAPPEEPSTDPEPPPAPPASPTDPTKAGGQEIPTETPASPSAPPSSSQQTVRPPAYDYRPWTGSRSTTRWNGNQYRPSSYTPTAPVTGAPYSGGTTVRPSGQLGRIYVDGYDSLIQWKQESPDNATPLQKPEVTTNGVRNALLLFLVSFAAGTILMYTWFKKER